ncbi:LuxR C-terminal-related transcriptional regulator [Geodermatophilus sp. SYSU D00691]
MRVAVAEDSLIVREGLTRLLESRGHAVVAAVDRPDRLAAEVARTQPDVVVVDIKMPPTFTDEGLRAAAVIRHRHPDVGVLVLSQYVAPGYVTWLLEQAPDRVGYLLKDRLVDAGALVRALERIAAGETVVDPELVRLLMRSRAHSGPLGSLTERERQVLALMAEGLSDRGIADRLVVSLHTVGTHVQHVFRKLAIPDTEADNRRVRAVVTWLQNGPPTPSGPPQGT